LLLEPNISTIFYISTYECNQNKRFCTKCCCNKCCSTFRSDFDAAAETGENSHAGEKIGCDEMEKNKGLNDEFLKPTKVETNMSQNLNYK
jgi:hypothetical protein